MDEKDLARNPLGVAHGAVDRFLLFNYQLKLQDHIKAVRHILNTGEGVVMEQCPNSDYIYFNAMYNAGWVQPESECHISVIRVSQFKNCRNYGSSLSQIFDKNFVKAKVLHVY